jgi:ribosomal protein S18 acetylase RimI-like enzyme
VKLVSLHSKEEIEGFLRRNTFLNIYSIGDLDDFFWGSTVWYALKDEEIRELLLMYTGLGVPTLLALTGEPGGPVVQILRAVRHLLPRRFYAHFSEGLSSALAGEYHVQSHGTFHKMALTDTSQMSDVDTSEVVRLTAADLGEIYELYEVSYPGNWFDPRMLETGHYYGLRRDDRLLAAAGVHVYSPTYRVAAIGNVTTHPHFRGRGLATAVCARLCTALLQAVDHIGLNVKSDNASAIASYERLGFERIAVYEECSAELKCA